MDSLYIIGNGFDLAHGLKTKYSHFRDFLVHLEREECEEVCQTSISDDNSLLGNDIIKYHFDNTVIPAMISTLSETLELAQQKDDSTGMTPLDQMDEITQFLNDADRIVQWIKHGSGQYYKRAPDESLAIKRFIEALEPDTGTVSHNTNLNTTAAYWQTIRSEFGDPAVKFLKNGDGSDSIPLWLTLRLFIKMIDAVEGESWTDLEASLGTNTFDLIFGLFKELESDEIYTMCVTNFFTGLYYTIFVLFRAWIIFTEIVYSESAVSGNTISELRSRIKMNQSDLEMSLTMKVAPLINECDHTRSLKSAGRHPMAKKQMIDIFDRAKNNYFFTFNYTQTLEHIYNVPTSHICYIHGRVKGSSSTNDLASDELIFGHGRESLHTNVVDVIRTAYNITKKPVKQCISKNRAFLDNLADVSKIYSHGFSFGDVDIPYIEKILQCIKDVSEVTWYLNDYGSHENRMAYQGIIRKAGFKGTFRTFHID